LNMDEVMPERVLRWIEDVIGSDAEVISVQRLHGGISSIVQRLSVKNEEGTQDLVLRLIDSEDWVRDVPDLAQHEAESLRLAFSNGLSAPQFVAFDGTGEKCGMPAVLMTCLEGTVIIRPDDSQRWIGGLAETLVRIHAVEAGDLPWKYHPYCDLNALAVPTWSSYQDLWRKFLDVVQGPRPSFKERFIHRDYHPTNILWSGNSISGIVDWINACKGPAGIDLGHCRINLALLHGVETADAMLSAYVASAGNTFTYDPFWDLITLAEWIVWEPEVYPGWTALGATDLTAQMMKERMDAYMISLMKRL